MKVEKKQMCRYKKQEQQDLIEFLCGKEAIPSDSCYASKKNIKQIFVYYFSVNYAKKTNINPQTSKKYINSKMPIMGGSSISFNKI